MSCHRAGDQTLATNPASRGSTWAKGRGARFWGVDPGGGGEGGGEQSNPNDGLNTQIKYRKYRRAANQIKWSPREKKSKSNPNQIPAQKTQMGPNGGARRAPPFGGLTALALTKSTRWHKSIIVDRVSTPTHDPGAIRSNVLLARLMRRMSVCEFGSVVRTY
jgi:hypothetical protein